MVPFIADFLRRVTRIGVPQILICPSSRLRHRQPVVFYVGYVHRRFDKSFRFHTGVALFGRGEHLGLFQLLRPFAVVAHSRYVRTDMPAVNREPEFSDSILLRCRESVQQSVSCTPLSHHPSRTPSTRLTHTPQNQPVQRGVARN